MKKIVFSLAAFAALSLNATTVQDPPPTQVNIDRSCPATVTAGTTEGGSYSSTYTENRSKGYDARTTVTDNKGYTTNYHTGAGQTTNYNGYHQTTTTDNNDKASYYRKENSNVSKIEVTCSPKE